MLAKISNTALRNINTKSLSTSREVLKPSTLAFIESMMDESNEGNLSTSKLETPTVVAALYKFARLEDYEAMREPLQSFCGQYDIKGTLLLAAEGINGTVAGSRESIDALLARLKSDTRLKDIDHKESLYIVEPFARMRVRLKKEIVTLGVEGVDPTSVVGNYVEPKDWNSLISDPDVLLIDTRNKYEVDLGTFKNSVDPKTETFREFPEFTEQHLMNLDPSKKIAMFCTGGIRCEKSTSYLKHRGFNNVYHLKGGILKYLEEIPKADSLWEGECYVFDQRISVNHSLQRGNYDSCPGCRHPLAPQDKEEEKYKEGIYCPYCYDNLSEKHLKRVEARHHQILLAETRNEKPFR